MKQPFRLMKLLALGLALAAAPMAALAQDGRPPRIDITVGTIEPMPIARAAFIDDRP